MGELLQFQLLWPPSLLFQVFLGKGCVDTGCSMIVLWGVNTLLPACTGLMEAKRVPMGPNNVHSWGLCQMLRPPVSSFSNLSFSKVAGAKLFSSFYQGSPTFLSQIWLPYVLTSTAAVLESCLLCASSRHHACPSACEVTLGALGTAVHLSPNTPKAISAPYTPVCFRETLRVLLSHWNLADIMLSLTWSPAHQDGQKGQGHFLKG